jgi:hypothetical protein
MFVKTTISKWERRWLMMFDNFDEPKAFEKKSIHHYIPDSILASVLFTSQNHDTSRLGKEISVERMSHGECLQLLLRKSEPYTKPYTEHEVAHCKTIAHTLGYLALAIDQAGAYICEQALDLDEFLPHYDRKNERMLNNVPDLWEYTKRLSDSEKETWLSVATTWELSLEQLARSSAGVQVTHVLRVLSLAAFLDNTTISERYFRAYFHERHPTWMEPFKSDGEWDSDSFRDVLAKLHKHSLVQCFGTDSRESNDLQFSLHPLVSEWTRLPMKILVRENMTIQAIEALTSYL